MQESLFYLEKPFNLWQIITGIFAYTAVLWERRPPRLFFINAGHSLLLVIIVGYLLYYLK